MSPDHAVSAYSKISLNADPGTLPDARGFIVFIGTQGFSIRTRLHGGDKAYTFMYGWPGNKFEFIFKFPHAAEFEKDVRQKLLDYGVFEKSGEKTMKSVITPLTIDNLMHARDFIFTKMLEIADV